MRSLVLLLLCALSYAGPTVRGHTSLTRALRAAIGDASNVTFVLDATPYLRAEVVEIGIAMQEIERAGRYRLALLGQKPTAPETAAGALTPKLEKLLATSRRPISTFRALHKTLGNHTEPGVIVYLADWHFEDDDRPEGLLKRLRARKQRFSVIGSEAAFGRGWNDGFSWTGEEEFADRIGKNPWRAQGGKVPWHGGETAYNHVPHRFGGIGWQTEFPRRLEFGENLAQRVRDGEIQEAAFLRFPLPSAFGPYALSRICQETGGRYVLWSWNRAGRSSVTYDYSRCELFAPDLRSRSAIRNDIVKRPLARAINSAWHMLAASRSGLVHTTPSVGENHATPQAHGKTERGEFLGLSWPGKASRDDFVRRAEKTIRVYDRALKLIDRPIRKTTEPKDPIDRRYLADAHLLQFIVRAQRFSMDAALTLARSVKDDAWKGEQFPALQPTPAPRASEIMAQRREFLVRYRGTPFGEQVDRNRIDVFELVSREMRGRPAKGNLGNNPAFSNRDRPRNPTPPAGGGSGGSGPSSGG